MDKNEEKKIIEFVFKYSLKEIEKTNNPCNQCAFCVRSLCCMSRKLCKYTEESPFVYIFEGIAQSK